ncbi:MAG: gluconokinase [Cytophagaceae bacterium]|nr:gluconokinase [Cytophagaceae bacterium]
MSYFIGVDMGTTATKAVAFDASGHVVAYQSRHYEMAHPQPDWSEQDPKVLFDAVLESLVAVLNELGEGCELVAFSSAMHSLMAVDENGKPLSNLLIWADNRANSLAEALKASETGQQIYQACGTPIHPMTPLCKLIWWRENEPELFAKATRFVGLKEYVWFRLTGEWVIDYSLATATGMFDLKKLAWNELALQTAGISAERLSKPVSPYTKRALNREIFNSQFSTARRTAFNRAADRVQLIIGASDGCLANLGAGAIVPGRLAVTIGTSGAVRVASAEGFTDPEMRTFCYRLDEELFVMGGGTNSGGVVFEWCCEQFFPGKTSEEVIALSEKIPPGAEGLLFLPYLLGERAPIWNADAKGGFFGLTLQHTPVHMARAVLEGICLHTYSLVKILEERQEIREIYASGGFAKSAFWVQLLADVCGKPVYLPESIQAGAWGAVLLGMKATGLITDFQEKLTGLPIHQIFQPDEKKTQIYQTLFGKFASLYEATKGLMV